MILYSCALLPNVYTGLLKKLRCPMHARYNILCILYMLD